jgi:TolB-like protein/DNA-binding winged helix-turn-helix (wHTH) protein/Tfp pilus assembly protein PilF
VHPATSDTDATAAPEITGYRVGDLLIDLGRAVTIRDGEEISLPRLTFDLLIALARAAPNVATTDELMRQVWPKVIVNVETVAQRVKLLRAAIGDDPQEPRYIAGVRGRGYRLVCTVEPLYASDKAPQVQGGSSRKRAAVVMLLVAALAAAGWLGWRQLVYHPAPPPMAGQLPPRSIAVLPFKDLNGDREDDVLALGIPEALLHQLARFEDLDVIARTSSFSFQGHDQDVRTIGQQLGARYILEGSVQRDQRRLRVTAQLVDAQSGAHVWSMQFDRTPQNIFEMQDAIALDVARALNISLQPGAAPSKQGTTPFEAYLEYLQGSRLLDTFRVPDMKAAAIHASRAIALDPNYADAFVLLAQANVRFAEYNPVPDRERQYREALPAALALLDRALALKPNSSSAYAERAYINWESDPAAAEADYRKALELNPSDVQALEGLAAVVYDNPARSSEALALIDRALKLDPLEPRLDVVKATYLFYGRSDRDGAEKLLQETLRRNPLYGPALGRLVEIYQGDGRFADGIKIAEQLMAADPKWAQMQQILQHLYLDIQDLESAEQVTQLLSPPNPALTTALLLAKGRVSDAGVQAWRTVSLGAMTPISEALTIRALRLHARRTGQYRQAIEYLAKQSHTQWDAADQPIISDSGSLYVNVVGLADLLMQSGQQERGRRLLEATLVSMDHEAAAFGRGTLWHHDMRGVALALLGRDEEAIAELHASIVLRQSMYTWWYDLELEPAYQKLRQDPRFQEILNSARTHAASERQALARLRSSNVVPDRSRRSTTATAGR